ncbi:MAG: selenocysteine-specific translation elongation factor [Pseudomonadales bacterium]
MIIATAGHVDHGKTLLVHALTGIDTDRLEVEKARGLTIELGFAYTDMDGQRIGFIDVPGHIRFINNMLAGVSVIDFALIVIAADDGVMPQTIEHLTILDILGIRHGAVALTKIDRVSQERLEIVSRQIRTTLAGTSLERSRIYPVSAPTGVGIEELRQALGQAAGDCARSAPVGGFRLAIDRVFSLKGTGLIVTGSVFSGQVTQGRELFLLPHKRPVRIRGMHRQDRQATTAGTGDRCALNLSAPDISRDDIKRGNWIAETPVPTTTRADIYLKVHSDARPLRHWTPVHVHSAANHITARVATLGEKKIDPGSAGLIQLVLAEPINLWSGDRIVLRDQSATVTIGGGHVIDPWSIARGRARPDRIAALRARNVASIEARLQGCLASNPDGLDFETFSLAENLTGEEARRLLDSFNLVERGNWVITGSALEQQVVALKDALDHFFQETPTAEGVTMQDIVQLLPDELPRPLASAIVERLIDRHVIEAQGPRFIKPGLKPALGTAEAALLEKITPLLQKDVTRPPVIHDLAKSVSLPPATVDKLLTGCARLGYLVKPTPNRFFLPEGMQYLEAAARQTAESSPDGSFAAREYRDNAGIGRNLAIEILEYFDRTGITVRMGETRKLRG